MEIIGSIIELMVGVLETTLHTIVAVIQALRGLLRTTKSSEMRRTQRGCLIALLAGGASIFISIALSSYVPIEVTFVLFGVGVGLLLLAGYLGNRVKHLS